MNIQRLRAVSERHMPSELTVTRYTYRIDPDTGQPARDRYGDLYPEEQTSFSTRCKLRSVSGDESIVAGRLEESAEVLIKAPAGTDIRSSDEVSVDGTRYFVKQVELRSAEQAADVKIKASRASSQE